MTIHAKHCRCNLCKPNRRRSRRSGAFFALAIGASAILAVIALFWLATQLRGAMLTFINL